MDKEKLPSLVAKAQEGDNQALNDLFTETYNDVYYFALKTVKDETLAADITQETFVTIFKNINSLNDNVAYPAWSRQITYRCCLQYLKKQNRETTVDENEDGSTIFDTVQEDREDFIPDKNLDKEDFKKTILDIVDSLPEEQRTAVILYYYDELSVKQIAEIQGVTEGTVKSRLNYARKTIKSSVETYEKKNNIKLHSVGILPLLMWLFGTDAKACSMPAQTVQTVASGVSAATGTTISISRLVHISSKLLGAMWQKIVAGVLAVGIVAGGVTTAMVVKNNNDKTVQNPDDSLQLELYAEEIVNDDTRFSELDPKRLVSVTFANGQNVPYFSNPDELNASDAFWYIFWSMHTVSDLRPYDKSEQYQTECYIVPITIIHSFMEEYLGRTYDCSNINNEKNQGFIGNYLAEGADGKPAMQISSDNEYGPQSSIHLKILQDKTEGDTRTAIICWYFTSAWSLDDPTYKWHFGERTVANWFYDETNQEYVIIERYCEVTLKPTPGRETKSHGQSWHIESYLSTENQDYEFTP